VNTKIQAALAAVALCAMMPASAFAATQSQAVNVSATVATDCALSVPSGTIALGAVDPLTPFTPAATLSSVSVNCNAGSAYTIGFGSVANTAPALTTTTFSMNNTTTTGHSLNYTASLASYGATAPSSSAVTDALTLAIVSGQDAYFGNYAGSFFVTVAF
jgi:spore coat protein U-like protein